MDGREFNDFCDFYVGHYLDREGKIVRAFVAILGPIGLLSSLFILVYSDEIGTLNQ